MIEIVSERPYKSFPKISKPQELKGIKPFIRYKWQYRRTSVTSEGYIKYPDVWIKLGAWFAGYAWLRVKNVLRYERATDMLRQITHDTLISEKSRFCDTDWRTITDICIAAWKGENNEQGNES